MKFELSSINNAWSLVLESCSMLWLYFVSATPTHTDAQELPHIMWGMNESLNEPVDK